VRPADEVVRYVKRNLQRGAVIVLHSSDHASANEALPGIIEDALEQGYTFGRFVDYLPLTIKNGKVVYK
ncbi:MAG: polysaccharide deacetylase family protein, partial [Clostridiales bacterium]|nr:polysaccharide deacetylase family protein [Clostridiales bacterium]